MEKETIATGSGELSATGLADSLFGASEAPVANAGPEAEAPKDAEDTSEVPTDENENGDATEGDEEEEATLADAPAKPTSYRIGNQEFASPEAVVREAQRVIGRSGQLAGDLRQATEQIGQLKGSVEAAEAKVKEWEEWAAANESGDNKPNPNLKPVDPDDIADRVAQRMEARRQVQEQQSGLQAEVEAMIKLPNFSEVADVVESVADQINPLTKKVFTPKEAYDYACRMNGVTNEWTAKPAAPSKPAAPQKADRTAVKSAAARPTSARQGTDVPKEKHIPSFAEEMLGQSGMIL